ncbi:hypothetical protein KBB96_11500 [Luteolibacter ambystomatis]|uniref:Uncharacterized protein n=1 Tax=Luteolibacter ambystomatis TaxID=2824561 RepID=A0A975IY44_9BACT|nr:hypothetical protein [Luteolibacter ambystomatis]QUE49498.1 hypothetical protein KBB96_11500 [Luteolibacter ambystomatis]
MIIALLLLPKKTDGAAGATAGTVLFHKFPGHRGNGGGNTRMERQIHREIGKDGKRNVVDMARQSAASNPPASENLRIKVEQMANTGICRKLFRAIGKRRVFRHIPFVAPPCRSAG